MEVYIDILPTLREVVSVTIINRYMKLCGVVTATVLHHALSGQCLLDATRILSRTITCEEIALFFEFSRTHRGWVATWILRGHRYSKTDNNL